MSVLHTGILQGSLDVVSATYCRDLRLFTSQICDFPPSGEAEVLTVVWITADESGSAGKVSVRSC